MLKTMIIVVNLVCPPTEVSNTSDIPWNKSDQISLEFNKKRCKQKYKYNPCLTQFIKIGLNNYIAVCGDRRKVK